jgi:BNR repeat-like domain
MILMNRKTLDFCLKHSFARLGAMLVLALPMVLAGVTQGQVPLTRLSTDTFKNSSSQHATEVEPDTYSFGSTIVTAFQTGRISSGGASDIGFATSTDGGTTWTHGSLPGITTFFKGGKFTAASDAAVVFDAAHSVWIVSSLGLGPSSNDVLASRSSDGITWNNPVTVNSNSAFADKDWITCDNSSTSAFFGHCYIEWEDAGIGDQVEMSTSSDGGLTWSAAFKVPNAIGLGGQPVVQTNGTAVVPFLSFSGSGGIGVFASTDGGKTWGNLGTISNVTSHTVAGNLRAIYELPSADVDAAGTIYVAWWDCRFRAKCSSNDIVMSTSTDGKTWSAVSRVPIDATTSTVDHFIPGLGVDHGTSGTTAHLAVTYYFYPVANCTTSTCKLGVGFISSQDGGNTWTKKKNLAGGMNTGWLPSTSLGQMVGDYIATAYVNGKAYGILAKAVVPAGGKFNEAMFTPTGGLLALEDEAGPPLSSAGEQPVPNAKSDHGPRQFYDSEGRLPIPPSRQNPHPDED